MHEEEDDWKGRPSNSCGFQRGEIICWQTCGHAGTRAPPPPPPPPPDVRLQLAQVDKVYHTEYLLLYCTDYGVRSTPYGLRITDCAVTQFCLPSSVSHLLAPVRGFQFSSHLFSHHQLNPSHTLPIRLYALQLIATFVNRGRRSVFILLCPQRGESSWHSDTASV